MSHEYIDQAPQAAPVPAGVQDMQRVVQYDYQQQPQLLQQQPSAAASWINFSNTTYLKGFVLGAGLTLVAVNPTVQKAVVSGAVKLWSAMQGGVEEIKEHVKDIKAEISTKE